MCIRSSLKYKVAATCILFLPYGCTSCDYIGDVTILGRFYYLSCGDSYQAGHSLSLSVWSEYSLSAWKKKKKKKKILGPYLLIAKFREVFPRNVAEKAFGEISVFLFFSAKNIISCKRCSAAKREKTAFFLGWSVYIKALAQVLIGILVASFNAGNCQKWFQQISNNLHISSNQFAEYQSLAYILFAKTC